MLTPRSRVARAGRRIAGKRCCRCSSEIGEQRVDAIFVSPIDAQQTIDDLGDGIA
jgi:hypothetical protein